MAEIKEHITIKMTEMEPVQELIRSVAMWVATKHENKEITATDQCLISALERLVGET